MTLDVAALGAPTSPAISLHRVIRRPRALQLASGAPVLIGAITGAVRQAAAPGANYIVHP